LSSTTRSTTPHLSSTNIRRSSQIFPVPTPTLSISTSFNPHPSMPHIVFEINLSVHPIRKIGKHND
jgi:hypothetical protein